MENKYRQEEEMDEGTYGVENGLAYSSQDNHQK